MEEGGGGGGENKTMSDDPSSTNSVVAESVPVNASKSDVGVRQSETSGPSSFNQTDLFRALEVVERDSLAIADSYTSLFDSLRLALSEVTSTSVDHIECFGHAVGKLQESAIEASVRGNRLINSCLRLNEEMKGIDGLAMQLKILRKNVDTLESAVDRLL